MFCTLLCVKFSSWAEKYILIHFPLQLQTSPINKAHLFSFKPYNQSINESDFTQAAHFIRISEDYGT